MSIITGGGFLPRLRAARESARDAGVGLSAGLPAVLLPPSTPSAAAVAAASFATVLFGHAARHGLALHNGHTSTHMMRTPGPPAMSFTLLPISRVPHPSVDLAAAAAVVASRLILATCRASAAAASIAAIFAATSSSCDAFSAASAAASASCASAAARALCEQGRNGVGLWTAVNRTGETSAPSATEKSASMAAAVRKV